MKTALLRLQFVIKFLGYAILVAYCLTTGVAGFKQNWQFAVLIFILEAAATVLPFAVTYTGSRTEFTPDSMVIVAAAMLLPTQVATVAAPLGYFVGMAAMQGSRGSRFAQLDQLATNAICSFLAYSAAHLVGPPGSGWNSVAAGIVASVVYELCGQSFVTVWSVLVRNVKPKQFFWEGIRTTATSWPWLVCLGVLLGILGWDKPLALPLMGAPLALIFVASRARVNATEDQARLDALLRATTNILAAPTVSEVTEAATAAAAALFERSGGRISSDGPQKGELGAPIPSTRFADQQLVVNSTDGLTAIHTRFDHQVLEVLASITASALDRAALHDDVADQALRDPLTGLSNRRAFEESVRVALGDRRGHETCGIIFLDLDGFKNVNDTHGHEAGDTVLIETANRLRQAVRGDDLIGRLGGDEFTILLRVHGEEDAILVAERVLTAMREPIAVQSGATVNVTPSLGIALSADARTDSSTLLSQADAAMYEAKHSGKDRWFLAGRSPASDAVPMAAVNLAERSDS